jgi:hypothetical protein
LAAAGDEIGLAVVQAQVDEAAELWGITDRELVAWFLCCTSSKILFGRVLTNRQKCGMIIPKIEKGNPSVNSTLLPNTIIISLVLVGLLIIIEELMVVGRRSD